MQGEGKERGGSPLRWTHSRARTSKVILALGPGDLRRAGGSVMHTYLKITLGPSPAGTPCVLTLATLRCGGGGLGEEGDLYPPGQFSLKKQSELQSQPSPQIKATAG